jgi:hypothetical protein
VPGWMRRDRSLCLRHLSSETLNQDAGKAGNNDATSLHRMEAMRPNLSTRVPNWGSLFLFGNTNSVSTVGPNFRLPFNAVRFTIRNTGLEFFLHESVFPGPQRQCCGNLLMAPQSVAACLPSAGL